MKLVEVVPNFSEGRRPEVVDRLAAAVDASPSVHLLDRTSDASHNRSVLTFAGPPDAAAEAMERAVAVAIDEIDMEGHSGEHPRIGAVDVIPFVPLGDTTMDEAVALARAFGARIADRFDLPVYLYANAASRPDRVKLADIRRGQYEGLREGDHGARAGAGFRAGPDTPHGGRGRGRRPALPDCLQHQSRLARRGAREAHCTPHPRIRRRAGRGAGQRLLDRGAGAGAGVDEPPGFHGDAHVDGVGEAFVARRARRV